MLLLESGAAKAEQQLGGERWRVFADPAGHPFCVVGALAMDTAAAPA